MISVAWSCRSSSGFKLIWIRPLFTVVFVPSTPMKDDKLSTAGVLHDHFSQLLLAFSHGREGDGLRRLGNAQNDPGILHGEEALGNQDVEPDRHRQCADGDHQRGGLVPEHPAQRPSVEIDD